MLGQFFVPLFSPHEDPLLKLKHRVIQNNHQFTSKIHLERYSLSSTIKNPAYAGFFESSQCLVSSELVHCVFSIVMRFKCIVTREDFFVIITDV